MKESRKSLILLAVGLGGCLAAGLISSAVPLARDQGVALFGARIIATGGSPYRDLFYFNSPGNFFVYRLALEFSPPFSAAVCGLDIIFLAASGLALFAAGRRAFSPRIGAVTALFFWSFALAYGHSYWNQGQKETLATLPLGLGIWALFGLQQAAREHVRSHDRILIWSLVFGACTGLAFQFKPTLGIVLPAVFLAVAAANQRRCLVIAGAAAGVGFLLALLPLALFLWSHGALPAVREGILFFGSHYGKLRLASPRVLPAVALPVIFSSFLLLTSFPAAVRLRAQPGLALAAAVTVLLAAQIVLQMKFFRYQFIPLLAPLSLLSAHSVETWFFGAHRSRWWRPALVGLLLFNLVPGWIGNYYPLLAGTANYSDIGGGIDQRASQAVAEYLNRHSSPADPVLVFGLEPGIYLLADRYPPTRFAYDLPLTADPAGDLEFRSRQERWREEFIQDLIIHPPRYIVINQHDRNPTEPLDSLTQAGRFPQFQELLDRRYHLEVRLGYYNIFARNSVGMVPQGKTQR